MATNPKKAQQVLSIVKAEKKIALAQRKRIKAENKRYDSLMRYAKYVYESDRE